MAAVLDELAEHLLELDFTNFYIDNYNQNVEPLSTNDQRISLISFILYAANLLMLRSHHFNTLFARHLGLRAHLKFLQSEEILTRILDVSITDMSSTSSLVDNVLLNIVSMSKNFEENPQLWVDLKASELLLNLSRFKPDTQFDAYLTIANIATDQQIEKLTEIHNCISILTEKISQCADDFKNDRYKSLLIQNQTVL